MRLVDDLAREDRYPVFRLHLDPFKGHSVPTVELASHDYAVDRPSASAHHLFTAALHSFWSSQRSSRQDGPSSPTGSFPLGEICHWVMKLSCNETRLAHDKQAVREAVRERRIAGIT